MKPTAPDGDRDTWVKVSDMAALFGISEERAWTLVFILYNFGQAELSFTANGENRLLFPHGFPGADGLELWVMLRSEKRQL